jgi:hypothetical protein
MVRAPSWSPFSYIGVPVLTSSSRNLTSSVSERGEHVLLTSKQKRTRTSLQAATEPGAEYNTLEVCSILGTPPHQTEDRPPDAQLPYIAQMNINHELAFVYRHAVSCHPCSCLSFLVHGVPTAHDSLLPLQEYRVTNLTPGPVSRVALLICADSLIAMHSCQVH